METILLVVHVIICVFLIGIILIQPNSSDGLSGIGGGNIGSVLTNRSAANILTKITYILFIAFVLNCIVLARLTLNHNKHSLLDQIEKTIEQKSEEVSDKLKEIEVPINN